jgi:4-amino-4-deoxy-L-arabinose transferase-like glycosyltransferase
MTDGPLRHTASGPGRPGQRSRRVAVLLGLALALRLGFIASRDPHDWFAGGDGPWYVQQGRLIAHNALPRPLSTVGPLYPLALAAVWWGLPDHGERLEPQAISPSYLGTVRTLQALVAVLTAGLAYALTRRLVSDPRAALLAGIGVGLGPAFVIEPFMVRTETLFMALFTAGLLCYVAGQRAPSARRMALSGIILGLAALTRPVLLLFPVVLAPHLVLRHGAGPGTRWAGTLMVAFTLTVLPWHVALYQGTGSWLPEGFGANLLIGASGDGRAMERSTFHELERTVRIAGRGLAEETLRRIAADPVHWLGLRARSVVEAVAQPHGTVDLEGPSVKQAARRWLREDRSLPGAWAIVRRPEFAIKAAMYAFHYAALTLAALGAWASRRRWREWLPIYLAIGYLTVAYGVLTILPRYLFPATVFLWMLAGLGLTWVAPGATGERAVRRR